MLGLIVNVIPVHLAALILIVAYGTVFGLAELKGTPTLRPPSSGWQVPPSFVSGRSRRRRVLVWGALLGPGFATRNPYAGFGVLVFAVAAFGNVGTGIAVAAAAGFVHGTGRALALLHDVRSVGAADPFQLILRQIYWRKFDAFALLVMAGLGIAACLQRF